MTKRPAIRDDLALVPGYHSPQIDVTVRLNTNEAPGAPPAGFAEAVAKAASEIEWHRYPDREAVALRSGIAELHNTGASDGQPLVGAENVFAANGSNEVIQTLLLTYAGPGRSVLTFEPTYAMHSHFAKVTSSSAVAQRRAEDFSIDPDAAVQAVERHRPAVTFLCSPNNPTGMVDPPETVLAVLAAVESVGGLLVVDEAYGQFSPWTALPLLDENRPLVVTRTFSKTWAMAGARLGYALGPTWFVEDLHKVIPPYHLDSLKQSAGVAALQFVGEMETRVSHIVEERGRVSAALADLNCRVWPSASNFVLFRPPTDGNDVWEQLLERSVLIRNTSSWPGLEGCLRATIGTASENDQLLAGLHDILGAT